eukprot:GEMP01059797.1.p1 GENE.GEMP01059797.1~~GEMP01059797.1.p1  ORF type:complete len:205 (+),score=36.45 GEMP01059797.1:22-615(+)
MELSIDRTWDNQPVSAAERVDMSLQWTKDKGLHIQFTAPFNGDTPPPNKAAPQSTWELWNYEVVELFIVNRRTNHYTEVEISPYGHYLLLKLHNARNFIDTNVPMNPLPTVTRSECNTQWSADFILPTDDLPFQPHDGYRENGDAEYNTDDVFLLNACAIRGEKEQRRYFVHTVMDTDEPDFHRIDRFTLPLVPFPA